MKVPHLGSDISLSLRGAKRRSKRTTRAETRAHRQRTDGGIATSPLALLEAPRNDNAFQVREKNMLWASATSHTPYYYLLSMYDQR